MKNSDASSANNLNDPNYLSFIAAFFNVTIRTIFSGRFWRVKHDDKPKQLC